MSENIIEEFFDIYSDKGELTGEIISRSQVHRQGLWHRSVHIWIVNKDKVLLQKRSESKESFPGKWDISAAGHISVGEEPCECAVRELQEEIGVDVSCQDLRYLFTLKNQVVLNNGTFLDNEINDVFLLDVSDSLEDIIDGFNPNEEVSFLKWVLLRDFFDMVKTGYKELVPHGDEYRKLLELDRFAF